MTALIRTETSVRIDEPRNNPKNNSNFRNIETGLINRFIALWWANLDHAWKLDYLTDNDTGSKGIGRYLIL